MGAGVPKQYLPLAGRPVIEHTLARLAAEPRIAGIVVALAEGDGHWARVRRPAGTPVLTAPAGPERAWSVLGALERLAAETHADDWVLVHDAARPCVRTEDVARLIDALAEDPVGGLLAVPVRDTLKAVDGDGRVRETVPRADLWHALTPQMFRLGMLREALAAALGAGEAVTDDAAAMERAGFRPRVVEGSADNIKITRPEDLALAELLLARQAAGGAPRRADAGPERSAGQVRGARRGPQAGARDCGHDAEPASVARGSGKAGRADAEGG